MPVSIFHVLTATTPDNTNFEIRPIAHWNASHLGTISATAGSELIGAFSNTNGVSFGLSAGLITVSVIGGQPLFSAGTTSNNLSQIVFSNSNGMSFGLNGSTITGSVSNFNVSAGTTSNNLASVVFSNANGVTFGLSGSTITASVPGGGGSTLTFIAKGNTTGQSSSSTMPFSAISFDGAGAISVGMSGGSLVVSAPNTVALTQLSAGMSTAGNTAGTASLATAQLVIVGSNNISLSQSYNLGSATLSIIGTGGLAIVASNTTFTSGTVVLSAAGGALTISSGAQSALFSVPATSSLVGASGLTISSAGSTISVGEILQSRWDLWPLGQSTSQQQTNLSASFRYIQLGQPVTFTRVDVPCLVSMSNAATTATADMNVSSGLVVYSRSGSTLSPITGAFGTTTYTWASNTSNYSNLTGGKNFSFPINGSLTAGEYWVGFQISTTNNSSIGLSTTLLGNTISMILGASLTASQIDDFGNTFSANVNAISQGMYTTTITATNQTIAISNISATGTAGMAGNFPVIFRNY